MESPPLDSVIDLALHRVDNEDVRIFYDYFETLKAKVRPRLIQKVKVGVGESAVLQSALVSMFQDVGHARLPLGDRDADGQPMFWPLLLGYLERHCDKWNKYYQTKKRGGVELHYAGTDSRGGLDPADPHGELIDEAKVISACEKLEELLNDEERKVFDMWVEEKTLDETAQALGCSEAKVSYLRKKIRGHLEAG